MKKPRIDAFVEPQKVKSLASPLDAMPAILPPRVVPAPIAPRDTRTPAPTDAAALPGPASPPSVPTATEAIRTTGELPAARLPDASHDLGELPYRKHSCLLTPDEFNALDELKVALRKKFNGTITKENLTRCAIRFMLDDYQRNGDESPVLSPIKKLVKEW